MVSALGDRVRTGQSNKFNVIGPVVRADATMPEAMGSLRAKRELARSVGSHVEFMRWTSVAPQQLAARSARAEAMAKTSRRLRTSLKACQTTKEVMKLAASFESRGLTAEDRTHLLETLREKKAWPEMARYYEQSVTRDPHFGNWQIPKEHYFLALNKSGRRSEAIAFAKAMCHLASAAPGEPLRASDLNQARLTAATGVNGEILSGLGSAFRLLSDAAAKGALRDTETQALLSEHKLSKLPSGPAAQRLALETSTRYYEAGFAVDCEYYPGINAVYNNLLLGNAERAEQMAPIVALSCEQAGGVRAKDYWCTTTMLELAVLQGRNEDVATLLPAVLQQASAGWELGSTAKSMERLVQAKRAQGVEMPIAQHIAHILSGLEREADEAQKKRDAGQKVGSVLPPNGARIREIEASLAECMSSTPKLSVLGASKFEDVKQSELFQKLEASGTYFRGMSSHFVGGNVPHGGKVPDMAVGRTDCVLAAQLLEALGIHATSDFEVFNARVDKYLAERFDLGSTSTRRPLEDLHSPEHVLMDTFRERLLEFTKTDETGSSITSVMAELAMGRGDCRHVAYSKQLLYDVWKKEQESRLGREAIAASLANDGPAYDAAMAGIHKLAGEQLLTFTSLVTAPIEMHEMYQMKTDASGAPIRTAVAANDTAGFSKVENHTYNALVRREPDGSVGLELRDAFYQQLYDFGARKVDPEAFLSSGGCAAGFMKPPGDYRGEPIPVQIILTRYSAGKIERVQGDFGGMRVGGQPVEPPSLEMLTTQGHRPKVVEALSR